MKTIKALFISKFFILAGLSLLLNGHAHADTVVYRVNAGGALLSGTPNWSVDTTASPSQYVNATATGNKTASTTTTINMTDPSLSVNAPPMSLFQRERWDPSGGSEMQWNFPATAGSNYQINLFFAETFNNAQVIGGRIFDVIVEGNVVLNDYDVFADVGANKGVMKSFTVTPTDNNIDIDFAHVVQNPSIKGIEIILLTGSGSSTLGASPTSVNFGSVVLGSSANQTLQLTNQGAAGSPNIVISSATITGTNSSDFSSNFSGSITLAPGQSTTVTTTCSPSGATGAKTASIAFAYNGGSAVTLSVPLTCNAVSGGSPGVLGASPTSLNFGSVSVGSNSSLSVQLTNQGGTGAQNITISGVSLTGTNASQFSTNFSGSVTLTPGQSTSINVTFTPSGTDGARTATLAVTHNGTSTSPLNIALSGNAASSTTSNILYRVNAGGPSLTSTPNWSVDTTASPSQYVNATATGNKTASTTTAINMTNPSLSGDTVPMSLFQRERWDPSGGSEMQWTFPLPAAGSYAVDLYFAETYPGTQSVGARVFDVSIEGSIVLDNYDIFADVGGFTGVKKTFNVTTTDTNLNINFGHVTQNPIIKGIQIRQIGASSGNPGVLSVSPTSLDFGSLVLGSSTTRQLTLTNQGVSGDSSITVNSASITGTNSAQFTSNFSPVTLSPGQSTTVTFTFSSSGSTGSKTATAAFVHNAGATSSPINVALTGSSVSSSTVSFGKSLLQGTTGLNKPTSLQFGPDGKLYVAQQNGLIRVYTVARTGANVYTVTATQNITLIQSIPNHNDDGTLNASIATRLVTGMAVDGTPSNPVVYVTSSDPRIGGGGSGTDLNLDTNSGIVSRLTWNGSSWVKLDLVRGLPRSEENHAPNGIVFDSPNNDLYIPTGGNTNHGGPSNNFAGLPEYAYSTALIKIDLDAIGNTTYDLPTLDDESRAGTDDANDPFGGNDGKNQAKLVQNGPVTIYASGFRNAYDVVLTGYGSNGPQFWTIDNGGNAGWGDVPVNEGPNGNCTNGLSEPGVTDQDQLHFISGPNTYFGHPNPTRANTANTFNSNAQSPVQFANPIECDYQTPVTQDGAFTTFTASTNGITQYLTNNFGGAMNGNLLAASFNNTIWRIILNSSATSFISKEALFSTVGGAPLDLIALDTVDPFPGTIWVADHGANTIVVFEPGDFSGGGSTCTGADNAALDEDNDTYDNADEIDNGTDPCSAADVPPDWDDDGTSNLNDPNDDNDSLSDTVDPFAIDPNNGSTTNLPVFFPWENDAPNPGGLLNLGFTGLMTNLSSNYASLFDANGMTTGGAAGVVTVDAVPEGDAFAAGNNQQYAFQFGINVNQSTPKFTAHTRIISPFAGITPTDFQSMGLFIGNGNQDNYFKIVTAAGGGSGAIQAGLEVSGSFTSVASNTAAMPGPGAVDLYLTVDPSASTVQAAYTITTGSSTSALTNLGPTQNIPSTWLTGTTKLAVGIISTSRGPGAPFPATWDFIEVASPWVTMPSMPVNLGEVAGGVIDNHMYIVGQGNNATLGFDLANNTWDATNSHAVRPIIGHHHGAEVFNGRLYLIGGLGTNVPGSVQSYNPNTNAWTTGPTAPFLAGSSATALINGKIYVAGGILDTNTTTNQVAAFDPAANSGSGAWSGLLAPMPQGVNHAAAATDGSKLYVFGGRTGGNSVSIGFNYVQIYNPVTNTWESSTDAGSTIPPLPQARGGMGKAVYFNGEFYVIGGETTSSGTGAVGNNVYNRVDIYNPATKTWRLGSTMPTARHGIFPLLYSDKIHVAGGGTSAGSSQSNVHERNDPRFDQN